jgi:cold shock CspA family protein
MATGTVDCFGDARGHGSVTAGDGDADPFVHIVAVQP